MAFPGFKLRVANDGKGKSTGKGKSKRADDAVADKETIQKPDIAADQIAGPQVSQVAKPDESGTPASPQNQSGKAAEKEIGGPQGPEPTRFGDWEKNGRCYDF